MGGPGSGRHSAGFKNYRAARMSKRLGILPNRTYRREAARLAKRGGAKGFDMGPFRISRGKVSRP